jgi:hypothetical protein
MTHDELIERIQKEISDARYGSRRPARIVAGDILFLVQEALRGATPAMVEAWEDAGPVPDYTSDEYQRAIRGCDESFIRRAHATGNWLAMLDASPLKPPEPPERS